jgi:hypothetical protein
MRETEPRRCFALIDIENHDGEDQIRIRANDWQDAFAKPGELVIERADGCAQVGGTGRGSDLGDRRRGVAIVGPTSELPQETLAFVHDLSLRASYKRECNAVYPCKVHSFDQPREGERDLLAELLGLCHEVAQEPPIHGVKPRPEATPGQGIGEPGAWPASLHSADERGVHQVCLVEICIWVLEVSEQPLGILEPTQCRHLTTQSLELTCCWQCCDGATESRM